MLHEHACSVLLKSSNSFQNWISHWRTEVVPDCWIPSELCLPKVFLDVAKAFDTVWIEGLLYKLTVLNFPSYLVHIISSYLRGRTFEASFLTATSSRRGMRVGVAQGGLISPVLFSLYLNEPLPDATIKRLTAQKGKNPIPRHKLHKL